MTITGITLEKMRNDQFIQFQTDILTTVGSNDPVKLMIKAWYDNLSAEMAEIDKLYKVPQGSVLTPEIEKADIRRDRAFSGINNVVSGYIFHFDPTFATAATLLQASIDKYGTGIAAQSLIAETTIITNLVGDWKNTPDLQAAITKLSLVAWSDELDAANKAFNQLYIQRNKETAGSTQSLDERRTTVTNDLYYKLRDKLLAYGNVNEFINPWAQTINEWNNLIVSYNQLIANNGGNTTPPAPPTP